MMSGRPKEAMERGAAADLWRRTLSQIPTVFGRLVYLSRLRDTYSGKYEHHGLAAIFGDSQADKALRTSHRRSFDEWLAFTLEQQKADLDLYLSEQTTPRKSVVQHWAQVEEFRTYLPASAGEHEKQNFVTSFRALLRLLMNAHGVAWPDRDA